MMRAGRNDVNVTIEDERLSNRRFRCSRSENVHLATIHMFVLIEITPLHYGAVATFVLDVRIWMGNDGS